ncbi:alpha/beta hydrolase [Kibdelosporangium phytohabitans]|uniref:Aminopeptidase n=1 Tax=Kibdelosporangium phytohabitans TaxID=860235 RepID=A0A0N9I5X8_9PSEU|nr:alpha/beta hydrolase [Kibdelosporangium phytohabitans]ALG11074.1 aminopeptidase [Kibdelosporangium phytohabitans]MBE1462315.1 pimeloyl-ACP methyl ester carboxylesterase [Kibdelosporangium phytohabitans]
MRRSFLVVAAAALLAGALAPQATAAPERPALNWGKCPPPLFGLPDDPRMSCAALRVPVDYGDPKGRTIDVLVSKLPTAKPGLRRGVLMHNAGGPGGPSLHLPAAYVHLYPQEVLDRYDLVSIDPRGVGYSAPVTCGRTMAGYPADRYFPVPAADGSIDRNVEFAKGLARDCLANGGPNLRHVTTANTARDMDRFRIALGEKKISYNSGSYGSYLGAVYATLFAERTDRVIVDSNVDPNKVWHDQWALWDHAFEVRFPDLAEWLADRDDTLKLGATPADIRKKFFELVDKLNRKPVIHPEAGPINGDVFRVAVFGWSYHTLQFPLQAELWLLADRGVPPTSGAVPQSVATKSVPAVPEDNLRASQLAVLCNDASWPRDPKHYQRDVSVNRKLFPLWNGTGTNIWPCAFWPDPVEPPVKVTGNGPANVLIVQTLRDPATPYIGALGMRGAFGKRAKMVTVNTGNHGAYDPSTPSCAVRAVNDFLAAGTLPARDTFCEPDSAPASAGRVSPLIPNL